MFETYGKVEHQNMLVVSSFIWHKVSVFTSGDKQTFVLYPSCFLIDPSIMQYTAKVVTTVDYGTTYGIPDTDGRNF